MATTIASNPPETSGGVADNPNVEGYKGEGPNAVSDEKFISLTKIPVSESMSIFFGVHFFKSSLEERGGFTYPPPPSNSSNDNTTL